MTTEMQSELNADVKKAQREAWKSNIPSLYAFWGDLPRFDRARDNDAVSETYRMIVSAETAAIAFFSSVSEIEDDARLSDAGKHEDKTNAAIKQWKSYSAAAERVAKDISDAIGKTDNAIEVTLRAPVGEHLGGGAIAVETRQFLRSLPLEERNRLLLDAASADDLDAQILLRAAFSAPAALSGYGKGEAENMLRPIKDRYIARAYPEHVESRRQLEKAGQALVAATGWIEAHLSKTIDAPNMDIVVKGHEAREAEKRATQQDAA